MYQVPQDDMNGNYKRPRTAIGGRGEGDWACPNCGNVNFSFRTTCNMRKCGTPKPPEADGPQGPSATPLMQSRYDPPPPMGGYMGNQGGGLPTASYAPPPGYTSMLQPSLHGGYAPVMQTGYSPHTAYMTIMPQGLSVGLVYQPAMDPYRGPPQGMVSYPPSYPVPDHDPRKRRGGPDASLEGDWLCPKCGNTNFVFRSVCNMRRCSEPKPTEGNTPPYHQPHMGGGGGRYSEGPPPSHSAPAPLATPDGSWTCKACGNVNYPFRTTCNRRNCGVEKPAELGAGAGSGL